MKSSAERRAGPGEDEGRAGRPEGRAERSYTITQLCEEFGVTARALRFYEDEGLISPLRAGLSRIYSWRDRARLASRRQLPEGGHGQIAPKCHEGHDEGIEQLGVHRGSLRPQPPVRFLRNRLQQ